MWRFLERTFTQGVGLVISLIIARILSPDDYGVIAIVMVVIAILGIFVDSGMGVSLIQKKEVDNVDFSTVFFFNIMMACVLYAIIFLAAPIIADFYKMPILAAVMRLLSLNVIISSLRDVQHAYVSRHLQFKKFFYVAVVANVISGLVGIFMAYHGFGVWALVGQQLSSNLLGALVLWFIVRWRPQWIFSLKRLKSLFGFGSKILLSKIICTIYDNLRTLIIGKQYSAADLAYYNRGEIFPVTIVANINSSIDSVLLPVMSKAQDNIEDLRGITRKAINVNTFLIAPLMAILFAVSEPLVRLILTEKWLPCVPFLRIFCITYAFYPIHTANLNAIKALGRSDIFLKLEIYKKIVGLIAIFSTMWISIMAMAYSLLFVSVASQIINSWPNKKLLNYSYIEQLKDILPHILLAVVVGGIVSMVSLLNLTDFVAIVVETVIFAALYILVAWRMHMEPFIYVAGVVKRTFKR